MKSHLVLLKMNNVIKENISDKYNFICASLLGEC